MSGLIKEVAGLMPPRARPYVLGAMILATFVSITYAIATQAADRMVAPVGSALRDHIRDDALGTDYDRRLQKAIWKSINALCKVTPDAECPEFDPTENHP